MEKGKTVVGELEPWLRLENKVVMVTGASSGLGREFCLDLAKAGCRVVAAARRTDRLQSLCDEINSGIGSSGSNDPRSRAVAVELDISASGAKIEASVQKAWAAFGRIDALINNAGIREFGVCLVLIMVVVFLVAVGLEKVMYCLLIDNSIEEWNDTVRTNLTGTWLVSKYVCVRMRDAKQAGSVISISSIGGLERGHLPGGLAYVCSKTAINAMTKAMALELGMYKIRVNSISPGLFKSEITQGLVQKDWLKNVERRTAPLRTFGTLDPALTSLLRYLIHDSSEYVTGNVFIVDAGVTLPGFPIFSSL
ncbi:3-oxoacyl-[acyl-carrier-protein] reductase fabg [Phtheirospermum japonicum]|uniref:3-oxoacyl-[acyl-carrier-protein] reductase fabg n=1 Tax=Phtheirospermum japonicum TaxID=374723 RepID=A0A830CEY8_9LAMI|nr:3-oxoacyl-[acyl-carrier-protein] reductase fabg [Phtheirospermum japonicum]